MNIKVFPFNPLQENTYLIWDESGEAAIIDAGMLYDKEKERIRRFIDENRLLLKRLINTHLHFDHQFGNKFLSDTYGVIVEAGSQDEFLLDSAYAAAKSWGIPYMEEPLRPCSHIVDNQIIKFGNTSLLALYTPGHSPGSYSFYSSDAGVVFTGDVLFNGSVGRTDFAGGDYKTLIKSIEEKLLTLPDETVVYSGHGPSTTIGNERMNNPFL